ncbi:carnitine O-palmitoyltransferase 1, liver isoform-like [Hetaerina americana]|uniref:carnitine O-palmitoyltransferase 1, liver isoform-like n=1 Tax=Hetaerina americana TaxID=62018 RepID=UPI003A7F3949
MAEARSAVSELRVPPNLEDGRDSWKIFLKESWKSIIRSYYRKRNALRNGTWPTSTNNLSAVFLIVLVLLLADPPPPPRPPSLPPPPPNHPHHQQPVTFLARVIWRLADHFPNLIRNAPLWLQASILSWLVSIAFFLALMKIRQYLLRMLLSYHGWMYAPPKKVPTKIKIWAVCVRLVSGYQPSLFSCQRSLPLLPVPPLKQTLRKLLASLKPLHTEEELKRLQEQAQEFEMNLGSKLQKLLVLKSWWVPNYVSDWWEKYVYLHARSPLANNSNFYGCDHSHWQPTSLPKARAATVAHLFLVFRRMIDREELPPLSLRSTIPLCMAQYERIFSTIRRPGEDEDELVHFDSSESRHVVVYSRGLYYRVDVYDSRNQLLSPTAFEELFNWIDEHSSKHKDSVCVEWRRMPALTALPRAEWAKIQKQHFSSGLNLETLQTIEKAAFMIVLTEESPPPFSEKASWLLHGDGSSLWFDKCFNLVVFSNGQCGVNAEHTMADAPIIGHMWEYAMTKEVTDRLYTEKGHCIPPQRPFQQGKCKQPTWLLWEVSVDIQKSVSQAYDFSLKNDADIHLVVKEHSAWGKGVMKNFGVSPDAFIQLALQLAYFRDSGSRQKFALTYEASMTRLFLCGRTETVRSCTMEVATFVRSMSDDSIPREEKIKLFRKASNKHQELYRQAMTGQGIDRHLFALYVCCRGMGYKCKFLEEVLSQPWTLSTSQQPHQQLIQIPDCNLEPFRDKVSPGGGFGPVSDDGYGVSYMLPSDHSIFFHVSSKHSSNLTDSDRFVDKIFTSLNDLKTLFEG